MFENAFERYRNAVTANNIPFVIERVIRFLIYQIVTRRAEGRGMGGMGMLRVKRNGIV